MYTVTISVRSRLFYPASGETALMQSIKGVETMKKSRKLLCMLLALVMVVSLLPVMAFAADEDIAAEEVVPASV